MQNKFKSIYLYKHQDRSNQFHIVLNIAVF
jgi:hypothetical protein